MSEQMKGGIGKTERILESFDESLPLQQAKMLSAEWYTDPDIYDLEMRHVIGKTWQPIGSSSMLPERGNHETVRVGNSSLLLMRSLDDGQLHAMSPVCLHKASPLRIVESRKNVARCLQCPYHHWTYRTDGRLQSAIGMDGVENFDVRKERLPQAQVQPWGPYTWVNGDMNAPTVTNALKDMIADIGTDRMSKLQWHARWEDDLACNWKVFIDNYLDGGYHVNAVHPELASVLDDKTYRTVLHENANVQGGDMVASGDEGMDNVRTGKARYWWVHPNFILNAYDGTMDVNIVVPTGVDSCKVIFDFYFDESWSVERREESIAKAKIIQEQDKKISEAVQTGLKSGAYRPGRYSLREAGEHQFHRIIANTLRNAV